MNPPVLKHAAQGRLTRLGAYGLFGVALLAILVGAYAAFQHYASGLREDQDENLLAIASLKRQDLEAHLAERIGDGRVLAASPVARALLNAPRSSTAAFESLTQAYRVSYGYERVVLVDRAMQAIHPSDADLREPAFSAFRRATQTGQAGLLDLHRHPGSSNVYYGYVTPVVEAGTVIGGVLMEVDANRHLLPLVQHWPTRSPTARATLMRAGDGRVELLTPPRSAPGRAVLEPHLPVGAGSVAAMVVAGESRVLRAVRDEAGVQVLAAAVPVRGTPWTLVTEVDIAEAEAEIIELGRTIAALAAALVIIAGAIVILIWRSGRQKLALEQAAHDRRYREVVELLVDGYVRLDAEGIVLECNEALARMTGFTKAELIGRSLTTLDARFRPEDIPGALAQIRETGAARFQTRWRRADGSVMDMDVSTVFAEDPEGDCFHGYLRDITRDLERRERLQRLNVFYRFLRRIEHANAVALDTGSMLEDFCRAAAEENDFALVWAVGSNQPGGPVRLLGIAGKSADHERAYFQNFDFDSLPPDLPSMRAMREQTTVVAENIASYPYVAGVQRAGQLAGLSSVVAVPVIVEGQALAAVNFYSVEPGYFDPPLVELLEESTRYLGVQWLAARAARERDQQDLLRRTMETRFTRLFEASPLAIQVHAATDGALLDINDAHRRLFGYTLEDVRGEGWFERAYPEAENRAALKEMWLQALRTVRSGGGTATSPDVTVRCKDGSERVVRGYTTLAGDDIIAAWVDMTEIRRMEQALVDSERRFARLYQVSPLPIQVHATKDGALININDAHRRLFGYDLGEIQGSQWFDKFHPDPAARALWLERWESHLRHVTDVGETGATPEVRIRARDGSDRVVRGYYTATPQEIVFTWVDLTDIRHMQDALQESEVRFRRLVDESMVGFYVQQNGRFVYVNAAYSRMLGLPVNELLGREVLDFVAEGSRDEVVQVRANLAAGKVEHLQINALRADGTPFMMQLGGTVMSWDGIASIAAQAEDVTERIRNETRIREYLGRLEQGMRSTLLAISRMVDLRDPYTAGHQRRVGLVAAAIAKELGWEDHQCQALELMGLVHDIGKISVPAELLTKPTRLNRAEFEIIKGHAQSSYDILKDVQFDEWPVAEIIGQHHERLDGSGYPRALKGDEILPMARVLTVADVFESMASNRPYRPALPMKFALDELRDHRGTRYDEAAVNALLAMVERGYKIPA